MPTIAPPLMRIHDELHALPPGGANLHTATASHRIDIEVADSFASRLRGLMLRRLPGPDAALLLLDCSSVHTAFMLMPIDVVYLDAAGVVTKCVPGLRPFRGSVSGGRDANGNRRRAAVHTLELAAGAIARLGIAEGDRVEHPLLRQAAPGQPAPRQPRRLTAIGKGRRQRGVAIVELVVVGPLLTILGMSLVQYGMLFYAKNQLNHASFMAARAGSVGNAKMENIKKAYARALIPLYGGGNTAAEIEKAYVEADDNVNKYAKIRLLNPTKESFDKYNDPKLQAKLDTGSKRVIPNSQQAFKTPQVDSASGQTIQDANMLKLRITHGYQPVVPIIGSIYTAYLKWLDDKSDAFKTYLISKGYVPIDVDVTVQMQSDAIEEDPMSSPGEGNNGAPTEPEAPPPNDPGPEPDCAILGGCSTPTPTPTPNNPGGGVVCEVPMQTTLSADTTFAFDKSTLTLGGMIALDKLVQEAKAKDVKFDKIEVTGYTDPLGSAAHNDALSKARAETVSNYLNSKGLTAKSVSVIGKGATDLIKTLADCPGNGDEAQKECLAPNRRVVVVLTPE